MADHYSPARIADRMEIQDVVYQWCRAVDRLDRQGMLDTFHEGATEHHGDQVGLAASVVDSIVARHQKIPFVSHMVGNVLIEFAGPNAALVESYMRNIRRLAADSAELVKISGGKHKPGVPMDLFTAARFVDRFERRSGRWRVAQRTLVQDWRQLAEVNTNLALPSAHDIVGRRDRQDPVYLARGELGIEG